MQSAHALHTGDICSAVLCRNILNNRHNDARIPDKVPSSGEHLGIPEMFICLFCLGVVLCSTSNR
jgi:hypothetical protein